MFRTSVAPYLAFLVVLGCERGQSVTLGTGHVPAKVEGAASSSADPAPASNDPKIPDSPPEITEDTPDASRPVTAVAVLQPARALAGESLTLVVMLSTAPTWHIYAADGMVGTAIQTTLKLELPEGVEAAGEWTLPTARQDGQSRIYEGSFQFRRRLKIGLAVKPGQIHVKCALAYQACDPFSCRPPEEKTLQAAAVIEPKP